MSFILHARFYVSKTLDPVGKDRYWKIAIDKRDEAIGGAFEGPILQEIRMVAYDRSADYIFCTLQREDSRVPIWSWRLNPDGMVIEEQCEYAP